MKATVTLLVMALAAILYRGPLTAQEGAETPEELVERYFEDSMDGGDVDGPDRKVAYARAMEAAPGVYTVLLVERFERSPQLAAFMLARIADRGIVPRIEPLMERDGDVGVRMHALDLVRRLDSSRALELGVKALDMRWNFIGCLVLRDPDAPASAALDAVRDFKQRLAAGQLELQDDSGAFDQESLNKLVADTEMLLTARVTILGTQDEEKRKALFLAGLFVVAGPQQEWASRRLQEMGDRVSVDDVRAYMRKCERDGRTMLGEMQLPVPLELIEKLGGDLTPEEKAICEKYELYRPFLD